MGLLFMLLQFVAGWLQDFLFAVRELYLQSLWNLHEFVSLLFQGLNQSILFD